jgi:MerR family transcriptional regulator, heat shock protein HspR
MKTDHDTTAEPLRALQIFEPDPGVMYTIEAAASITQVPRRLIAVYCKLRMVSPVADSEQGAFYFNDEGIRALRQIDQLRSVRGINLDGIKMILDLEREVDQLRGELRSFRR